MLSNERYLPYRRLPEISAGHVMCCLTLIMTVSAMTNKNFK